MTGYAIPIGGGLTFTARQDRQARAAVMQPGASGLQVAAGVRPGPGLDVSVAGGTITVTPGAAVVQSAASSVAGAYWAWIDANFTTALTAADASNPRSDLVYLRVRDTDEDGSGFRDCTPVYVAGTPAASPVTPSIPGSTAGVILGVIAVPKSGTGSPTVSTTTRPLAAAAGGITPVPSGLLATSGQYVGQARYNQTRGLPEYWSGSAWAAQGDYTTFVPVWTALTTNPTLGNGTLTSRWTRVGRLIHWWGALTIGSTTNPGNNIWFLSPPVAVASLGSNLIPRGVADFAVPGTNNYVGETTINPTDPGATFVVKSSVNAQGYGFVTHAFPLTPAAGYVLHWNITYEAAT